MAILRSFIPWILFFILNSYQCFFLGAILAVGYYALVYWHRPQQVQLLDYTSAIFLGALVILIELFHLSRLKNEIGILGNAFLAGFILVTLLINRPFSLGYAKAVTPKEKWDSPHFFRINQLISLFWLIYFCLTLPVMIIMNKTHPLLSQIVQLALLFLVLFLTKKFPAWYVKKIIPAQPPRPKCLK